MIPFRTFLNSDMIYTEYSLTSGVFISAEETFLTKQSGEPRLVLDGFHSIVDHSGVSQSYHCAGTVFYF